MPGQPAYVRIVEEFGPQVVQEDGSLDRKALGAIVFADPPRRKRLEEITHPAIGLRQQRILSVLDEESFEGVVLWDAALLFESGGVAKMDRVVVVFADPDTEACLAAERATVRALEADCHTPVGASATTRPGGRLRLTVFVGAEDGSAWIRDQLEGNEPEGLGARVAARVLAAGAAEVLGR